jgi:type I restriction enzyme R subunit
MALGVPVGVRCGSGRTWLDLLGSYVHPEEVYEDGGVKTGVQRILFPRFHQWDAVTFKLLAATRAAGAGVDRLVMHSAGSGKSEHDRVDRASAVAPAHAFLPRRPHCGGGEGGAGCRSADLRQGGRHHRPQVVLDRQLQATVAGLEHTPGTIVTGRRSRLLSSCGRRWRGTRPGSSSRRCRSSRSWRRLATEEAAAGEQRGVVGRRFAVIVDEAHSSTTGEGDDQELKTVLGGGDAALEAFEEAALAAAESR